MAHLDLTVAIQAHPHWRQCCNHLLCDGTIRFWDLEKKRSVRSRNENRNNDSGSSNSSGGSAAPSIDISCYTFYMLMPHLDACSIPTANSTITSSPKATSVDTQGGLPLSNSENGSIKSLAKVSYDAELPPKARPNDGVRCIDVSPDGRWLASGDRQGRMRIYDLRDMSEFSNIKSHDAEVLSISFCPRPPPKGLDASANGSNSQQHSPAFNMPSLLASVAGSSCQNL